MEMDFSLVRIRNIASVGKVQVQLRTEMESKALARDRNAKVLLPNAHSINIFINES